MKAALALVVPTMLSACVAPTTSSHTLKSFDPNRSTGKIAIWMDSDGNDYKSSDTLEPKVRTVLTQEIEKKGWRVVPSMKQADYGLLYVSGLSSSNIIGYSVSADYVSADRVYVHNSRGGLFEVRPDYRPGEKVWDGKAFLGQGNLDFSYTFPTMAKALIQNEFPARSR